MEENKNMIIWKDRKRTIFGLPISFSEYAYTNMFMTNFDPNSRYSFIK